MAKFTIISATTGEELACIWAGHARTALVRAWEMFPARMVAVVG